MSEFEAVFGVPREEITPTCILIPCLAGPVSAQLKCVKFAKGKLYSTARYKGTTIVHTRIGPAFTGDAALYLTENGCRRIVLFGACGSLSESRLPVGALVSPETSYAVESFSSMLAQIPKNPQRYNASPELLGEITGDGSAAKVCCLTTGSLKLEAAAKNAMAHLGIDVIDMECSALFSAAAAARAEAAAIMFVTDIVAHKPYYRDITRDESTRIDKSVKSALAMLCGLN